MLRKHSEPTDLPTTTYKATPALIFKLLLNESHQSEIRNQNNSSNPAFLITQQNHQIHVTFKRPPPTLASVQASWSPVLQNSCWSELASCNEIWGGGVGVGSSSADPIFVAECITGCERGCWKPVSWRERTWSVVDCRQCEPGEWELRYHFFLI